VHMVGRIDLESEMTLTVNYTLVKAIQPEQPEEDEGMDSDVLLSIIVGGVIALFVIVLLIVVKCTCSKWGDEALDEAKLEIDRRKAKSGEDDEKGESDLENNGDHRKSTKEINNDDSSGDNDSKKNKKEKKKEKKEKKKEKKKNKEIKKEIRSRAESSAKKSQVVNFDDST